MLPADIDECEPGREGSGCNASAGGVCLGHFPDKKFQCTCQPGYELNDNKDACHGL